jgi:hypothetical protein
MSPLSNFGFGSILLNNRIGTNVGNLLYAFSIYRLLTTDENVLFTPTNYRNTFTQGEIELFNSEYEAFIIPLADAFRTDFVPILEELTVFIRQLTIPVIIVGVGLRTKYEPNFDSTFPFDSAVKAFVSTVLSHSSLIGVRGEITGTYLAKLGFKEESDYMVIGCPSLYSYGSSLKIRDVNLTPESIASYNSSITTSQTVQTFLQNNIIRFSQYYFVPQVLSELRLMFFGTPYLHQSLPEYPSDLTDPVYKENHARFFASVPSWVDFMRGIDFSFGSRLHGTVAGMLAGTPSLIFPKDSRTRELAEYHHMAAIPARSIQADMNIFDLIDTVDFHAAERNHKNNYRRYLDFLNKNRLNHIYEKEDSVGRAPLDILLAEQPLRPPLESLNQYSFLHRVRRRVGYARRFILRFFRRAMRNFLSFLRGETRA